MTLLNIRINKCDTSVELDTDKLPKASIDWLLEYGAKQKLNDVHASEKEAEHALILVNNVIDNLMAGILPANGGGSRIDPVVKVAIELFALKIAQSQRCTKKVAIDNIKLYMAGGESLSDAQRILGQAMTEKAKEKIKLDAEFNLDVDLDI